MNVLIIGSGGREHALAWKVAQDPRVAKVFVAPGNAGTATEAKCENVAIDVLALEQLADFAAKNVQLTIVGPEAPLVAGVVDLFRERGLDIFGPTAGAAQLEGSKAFTKDFLARHRIPTAAYRNFTEVEPALAYLREQGAPIVIKADGLAAGKGVIVAMNLDEAEAAVRHARRQCLRRRRLARGDRGVPRWRGGQLHRHGRRPERAADGHQPGPQARRRWRQRAEHRRHGRLLAGPGGHRRGPPAGAGRSDLPDGARHGRGRQRLYRLPLCRPDDRQERRAQGHRIQLPLRRPGNPADHGPPGVLPGPAGRGRPGQGAGQGRGDLGPASDRRRGAPPAAIRATTPRARSSKAWPRPPRWTARCSTPAPR